GDNGLAHLEGMTHLEYLSLAATQVTDAGLKHLKGMTKLDRLSLASTKVSDAGMPSLAELTGLRTVYLGGTAVTDTGAQNLRKALPKVSVSRLPGGWHALRYSEGRVTPATAVFARSLSWPLGCHA